VPKSLGNLTALRYLDLGGNQLTTVPKSLGNLTALTDLDLGGNQLTTVPKSLGNLTTLSRLDLNDNQLTAIPRRLAEQRSHGLLVQLADNPLVDIDSDPGQPSGYTLQTRARWIERLRALMRPNRLSPPSLSPPLTDTLSSEQRSPWPGESLDRTWMRLRSLFVPSVSLAAVLAVADKSDSRAAVLQLYTWERERLLTLAKGTAGAAITVLTGLIATAIEGKVQASAVVLSLAAVLVAVLLFWGGFLLIGLRRLAEEYTTALDLTE
jgi:hypothetical protein